VKNSAYSALRVGAVIIVSIVILCFAIFQMGHGLTVFSSTETIEAHFQRINGLQKGAPVSLSGVNIGNVDEISFPAEANANYVVVTLKIASSAAPRVKADAIAQISSMGLLGDKFVEVSAGSPLAPSAEPGSLIAAHNPIDYETLIQQQGADEMIANLISISGTLRMLLDKVATGNSVMAELFNGDPNLPPEKRLSLASIQEAMTNVSRLSTQLEKVLDRVDNGKGIAGALLSDKYDGRAFVNNLQQMTVSVRNTSDRIDRVVARYEKANGMLPQLMENQALGSDVLGNLRTSSRDLKDILHKINASQGTAGMLVNDPTLYNELRDVLEDGGGWGIRFVRSMYLMTHPFAGPIPSSPTQAVSTTAQPTALTGSEPVNPAMTK
jgi:phospholipid/cholesterol/gamma-HCH transport system substrate-binding protein